MPLFSVIVPTYNTKKYLRQCINSVLSQKYQNFEIILVNDCSTDGSGKICEGYKKNKKVKIIHNKKNCGAGLSRNKGISVSTGKYILFLDSDDYLYQGCFTGLEKLIRKNNNIDVIITKFLAEQPPYSNDYLFKKDFSKSNNTDKFISHINKINYQANVCWHYIIKKNLIVKNKLKFVDAKLNEDQEFVTRLLCLMRSFALYKGRYYWHRERPGSLNRSIDLKTTKSFLLVFNELSQFINKSNLSNEKKKFIKLQIRSVIVEFSSRLTLHNYNDINRLLHFLNKFKKSFKILDYNDLSFLMKRKKNLFDLLKYKKKVVNKIKKKLNEAKLNNSKIFVYCASVYGIATFNALKTNKCKVISLIDDNKSLQLKKIHGIYVNKPSVLSTKSKDSLSNIIVIVCAQVSKTFKNISIKLKKYGIKKNKIIFNYF